MPGPDKRSLPNGSDGDGVFAYKPSEEESFFIPSYLQNSRYMEKLQNLHNHSQQKRHAQSRASNPASRSASSTNLKASGLSKGANQSIVNDIAERTSPVHLDDTLRPLPSRWVENTKTSSLLISHDGRELLLRDDIKSADDAAAVKANNYIPQECGIYYYEVTLMSKGMVGLGLSGTRPSVTRLPGWEQDSWGYHGDDGFTYGCTATAGKAYGPKFSENDVVGCGVDFRSRTIFYTKNGVFLGDAHHDVPCNRLYPSIGMKKRNDCIRTNFGQAPFVFDIDSMVENERRLVQAHINKYSHQNQPGYTVQSENDEVQRLVTQYLAHQGYIQTLQSYTTELHREQQSTDVNGSVDTGVGLYKDAGATHRQLIRQSILKGEIDRALKYINLHYPDVLKRPENRDVYFRLRCRKFIEMIRSTAEASHTVGISATQNDTNRQTTNSDASLRRPGLRDDVSNQNYQGVADEDLYFGNILNKENEATVSSRNSSAESMNGVETIKDDDDLDVDEVTPAESTLTQEDLAVLTYGTELQEEFKDDPRPEVAKTLVDTFALIAYPNAMESELRDMLDPSGRSEIAEDVNGAILVAQGQPRDAVLNTYCAQTEVLLDMLSASNGTGSMINVRKDYLR